MIRSPGLLVAGLLLLGLPLSAAAEVPQLVTYAAFLPEGSDGVERCVVPTGPKGIKPGRYRIVVSSRPFDEKARSFGHGVQVNKEGAIDQVALTTPGLIADASGRLTGEAVTALKPWLTVTEPTLNDLLDLVCAPGVSQDAGDGRRLLRLDRLLAPGTISRDDLSSLRQAIGAGPEIDAAADPGAALLDWLKNPDGGNWLLGPGVRPQQNPRPFQDLQKALQDQMVPFRVANVQPAPGQPPDRSTVKQSESARGDKDSSAGAHGRSWTTALLVIGPGALLALVGVLAYLLRSRQAHGQYPGADTLILDQPAPAAPATYHPHGFDHEPASRPGPSPDAVTTIQEMEQRLRQTFEEWLTTLFDDYTDDLNNRYKQMWDKLERQAKENEDLRRRLAVLEAERMRNPDPAPLLPAARQPSHPQQQALAITEPPDPMAEFMKSLPALKRRLHNILTDLDHDPAAALALEKVQEFRSWTDWLRNHLLAPGQSYSAYRRLDERIHQVMGYRLILPRPDEIFDPERHERVGTRPQPGEFNRILEMVQPGLELETGMRLLKARVIVSA